MAGTGKGPGVGEVVVGQWYKLGAMESTGVGTGLATLVGRGEGTVKV